MGGDLFQTSATEWVIFNAAGYRWGADTYPTEAAARAGLKSFWKGTAGVKLDRFYVEELPAAKAATVAILPRLNMRAA